MSDPIEDLKKQQQLEEAKASALKARAARIRAEKDLAKAQRRDAPDKADFEVPDSGYRGDVRTGVKAGVMESALLAARALTIGARRIAERLKPALDAANQGPVLLYAYSDIPALKTFVAYKAQYEVVEKALESALAGLNTAAQAAPPAVAARFIAPGEAGLALEGIDKLLGFFRTDYSVEGVEVKFDDNIPLLNALAGELAGTRHNYDVRMPSIYRPPVDLATDPIVAEVNALASQDVSLRKAIAAAERQLAAAPQAEAPDPEKVQSAQSIASLKDAVDFARSAQTLYDIFSAQLAGANDKSQFPLDTILRENALRTLLRQGSPLLAVRIDKAGGSYYTRRNLWSFFGGMPFFNTGGVVLTYSLFDGPSGRLLASGTLPVDGGFVKISNLSEELGR